MSSRKYVGPVEICRPEKKKFGGAAGGSAPLQGGPPPLTPLRARHRRSHTTTRAKNITHTQHSPTCCFLCTQGVTGLHSQQSKATMPMDPLHQENFSVLTDFVNESATFFKVSTFISDTFFSSIMSLKSDIEHQCALSLNDKQGSSPRKLHSDCHTLSLQLLVPTQYLNTIFVTILLPYLHEWLPCIQIL
jgi:hypothetical protein